MVNQDTTHFKLSCEQGIIRAECYVPWCLDVSLKFVDAFREFVLKHASHYWAHLYVIKGDKLFGPEVGSELRRLHSWRTNTTDVNISAWVFDTPSSRHLFDVYFSDQFRSQQTNLGIFDDEASALDWLTAQRERS